MTPKLLTWHQGSLPLGAWHPFILHIRTHTTPHIFLDFNWPVEMPQGPEEVQAGILDHIQCHPSHSGNVGCDFARTQDQRVWGKGCCDKWVQKGHSGLPSVRASEGNSHRLPSPLLCKPRSVLPFLTSAPLAGEAVTIPAS